jgi:iron complex outermembrane receptor protein
VGFKTDLFDRRFRLNAAAFYNDFSNIILNLNACPGTPCAQPSNIGTAEVKGFELEAMAFPVDGLSLDGSLSYLDFKYDEITGPTTVTLDMVTPYTPEWTYSFGIQYDYEFDEIGTLSARFDGSYQSEIYANAINSEFSHIDSYFLGNGRLTWTDPQEDWQVALEVQNIFEKYYFLTVFDQATGAAGQVEGQPGMPRTWAVTLKRNF